MSCRRVCLPIPYWYELLDVREISGLNVGPMLSGFMWTNSAVLQCPGKWNIWVTCTTFTACWHSFWSPSWHQKSQQTNKQNNPEKMNRREEWHNHPVGFDEREVESSPLPVTGQLQLAHLSMTSRCGACKLPGMLWAPLPQCHKWSWWISKMYLGEISNTTQHQIEE